MGTLTQSEAISRRSSYEDIILQTRDKLQKNFDDMDFENANRKEEMRAIIEIMKRNCEITLGEMYGLSFEW